MRLELEFDINQEPNLLFSDSLRSVDRNMFRLLFELDFFFFSSRRRHTRLQGDWSSDVCSSDLTSRKTKPTASAARSVGRMRTRQVDTHRITHPSRSTLFPPQVIHCGSSSQTHTQIGRASCRERV